MEPEPPIRVRVRRLRDDAVLPRYMTGQAAGMDLAAALDAPVEIAPGARALVGCGFAIELPPGHEAQIRPRSGLALDHGVTCLNSPGTIDADYRGEVKVILVNLSPNPVTIKRGERIAQLVIAPVSHLPVEEVREGELSQTARGEGGFGSTGRA